MAAKFTATTLVRTKNTGSGALAVTLADEQGRKRTLTLTADLAMTLSDVLANFGATNGRPELEATKRPQSYAIGSAKYENVVLLRFEDDAPYALPARSALELAKALLEQSEVVALRPVAMLN